MTSIYDIPYEDIKIFLLANSRKSENEDEDYKLASILLKDKKAKGHTMSIIEWMMAHNLVIKKIDIPYYTTYEIDNMSQNEINQLTKLLGMNGKNRSNIKNILRYLHKLDDEITPLPTELQDFILNNLTLLELQDIDIVNLKPNDIINLFKNYRDKRTIRKFISDNMRKILFYNFLDIDVERLDDFDYIMYGHSLNLNDYTIYKLIEDNKEKLIEENGYDKIIDTMTYIISLHPEENITEINIGQINMDNLLNFIVKLTEINEIELAKKAIFLANKYKFYRGLPFNFYLSEKIVYDINDINVVKMLIDNMGENIFIEHFEKIIQFDKIHRTKISVFLKNLVALNDFDLLLKSLQILIDKDYTGNKKIIVKILQGIKRAMRSKDDDKIIRYIDIIGTMSFLNTVKSGNRVTNARKLENFNKQIKEAEEGK